MQKRKSKLQLCPLDLTLFHYLFATNGATVEQINRDVYGYKRQKSLDERIKKLESLVFIQELQRGLDRRRKVLVLTKHGFQKFVVEGHEKRVELQSSAPHHDLGLVDLRAALLRSPKISEYVTENELQTYPIYEEDPSWSSFIYIHADAAVCAHFSSGNIYFAVEYEAQRKSKDRYKKLINRYYNEEDVAAVLYISRDIQIQKLDQKIEEEHKPNSHKIFYAVYEDVTTGDELRFTSLSGKTLSFGRKQDLDSPWNSPIRENAF